MSGSEQAVRFEDLLEHADWVRGLARRLILDSSGADDVVQDAWVAALETPPRHGSNLKAWLGRVVTNVARSRGRAETRRARRESDVARDEATAATDELVQEASMSRELVGGLIGLEEPYRTVLLMRYFRDRSLREIARELDRPLATVRTQAQRGLAKMREQLDQRHGKREAWCALLLPLACGGVEAAKFGAATPIALALACGLLALTWFGRDLFTNRGESELTRSETVLETNAGGGAGTSVLEVTDVASTERVAENARAGIDKTRETTAPDSGDAFVLTGRLVDVTLRPLSGLEIVWRDPARLKWANEARTIITGESVWLRVAPEKQAELRADPTALDEFTTTHFPRPELARALINGEPAPSYRAHTGAEGNFELRLPQTGWKIDVEDNTWGLLGRANATGADAVHTWVAARRHSWTGDVVDPQGRTIEGAVVTANSYPTDAPQRFRDAGYSFSALAHETTTGPTGEFALTDVPLAGTITIIARMHDAHSKPVTVHIADNDFSDPADVRLVLPLTKEPASFILRGSVRLPDGTPAPRTTVAAAGVVTQTASDGTYELEVNRLQGPLAAVRAGAGFVTAPLEDLDGATIDVPCPDLFLPGDSLAITGIVVDDTGRPIAGAKVRIENGARVEGLRHELEDLAAGRTSGYVESDEDGRFALDGLLARSYAVTVRVDGNEITSEPIAGGTTGVRMLVP